MHKKTRKNSALLLLVAPIFAIGSSALVAGTAASAGATAKKVAAPTIKICEVAPGAFRFALNGNVLSFKGSCGTFKAKVGANKVSEVSSPALYRTLSSIAVSPASVKVSASLKTEIVTIRLLAGKSATVKFLNSKLVVVVSNPAPANPPPSDPSPSNPPAGGTSGGGTSGGSSPAPVANQPPASTGNGYIEVCKTAADDMVEGTFSFAIASGSTSVANVSLTPVWGQNNNTACTGPISAPAGSVSVTEASEGPGYGLASVTASPASALGTVDLATQTASFTVTSGLETTADFIDATQENLIKVCKILANNLGSLAGTSFSYTVDWTFTPPTLNLTTPDFTGTETVSVVAGPAPGEACTWVPSSIPAGSVVTVNEIPAAPNSDPFVTVTNVSVTPPQYNAATATTPATEAVLTVPAVGDGFADAEFTNTPMGYIEVCKNFAPRQYNNRYNFATFTVNGGTPFEVQGGDCSAPIEVVAGAGTATITETIAPNYYFEGVTAVAAVESAGPVNELVSGATVNPAVVNVPYGNVGNETVVTYTNGVDPTAIKICATEPSATPDGQTVNFDWSYTDSDQEIDPTVYEGSRIPNLTITASDPAPCELFNGPPVFDPEGNPYMLTITETSISDPSAVVTGISYQGNGSEDGTTGVPGIPASITITLGLGSNAVTFTNGPSAG